jgi:hypothetical protein
MAQLLSGINRGYDHNQTERERILLQDGAELSRESKYKDLSGPTILRTLSDPFLSDGVLGHRSSEDAHPRRRAFLFVIRYACFARLRVTV